MILLYLTEKLTPHALTDRQREKEIVNRLLEKNNGPLGDDGLRNIFGAIIAEGRNVQRAEQAEIERKKND